MISAGPGCADLAISMSCVVTRCARPVAELAITTGLRDDLLRSAPPRWQSARGLTVVTRCARPAAELAITTVMR
jgi:hypothetical protein